MQDREDSQRFAMRPPPSGEEDTGRFAPQPQGITSWRPNGATKMVIAVIVTALVTVAFQTGLPALISADKDGAVRDAVQDQQIQRLEAGQRTIADKLDRVAQAVGRVESAVKERRQ